MDSITDFRMGVRRQLVARQSQLCQHLNELEQKRLELVNQEREIVALINATDVDARLISAHSLLEQLVRLGVTLLVLMAVSVVPAYAQTSLLPTLQAARAEYPQDWSHEQRGAFLNQVAWLHRAEGWGLLRKPGGNRCPTPQGIDVSCDYLVYRPTMQGFDVLMDESTPMWRQADSFASTPERWVGPGGAASPTPTPTPDPTPIPGPTQPNLGTLESRVIIIQQVVAEIRQQNMENTLLILQRLDKLEASGTSTGDVMAFLGKYVAPAVGAAIAAWQLRGDGK